MKKTTLLKKLILDDEILVMPGAHDPLSARVIQSVGFKALILGGYSATASRLGKPDISLLSMTEMVNCIHHIVEAVDIPLFADADTGHGNVTNVQRTVREFEKAGAAALFLEDQVFPKRCGHMDGKQIVSIQEMVAKVKAAVDARIDQDMMIMARTDAVATDGVDEAIERANIYVEAGADLILVEAPTAESEMKRANDSINAPTMANMVEGGKTPILNVKKLQELGFALVCIPNATVYATSWALRGMWETVMKDGDNLRWHDKMIQFEEFNELIGLNEIRNLESLYYREIFESIS